MLLLNRHAVMTWSRSDKVKLVPCRGTEDSFGPLSSKMSQKNGLLSCRFGFLLLDFEPMRRLLLIRLYRETAFTLGAEPGRDDELEDQVLAPVEITVFVAGSIETKLEEVLLVV